VTEEYRKIDDGFAVFDIEKIFGALRIRSGGGGSLAPGHNLAGADSGDFAEVRRVEEFRAPGSVGRTFVTQDKIYCVYIALNEAMVREHAKPGRVSSETGAGSEKDDRSDIGVGVS
jgi:hypothetical protein